MPPNADIATRALVVSLKALADFPTPQISELTGLSQSQINRIFAKAIKRGFDPKERPMRLRDEHLQDAPRPGRPSKQAAVRALVEEMRRPDHDGQAKSAAQIFEELKEMGFDISPRTVQKVIQVAETHKAKHARPPRASQVSTAKSSNDVPSDELLTGLSIHDAPGSIATENDESALQKPDTGRLQDTAHVSDEANLLSVTMSCSRNRTTAVFELADQIEAD